jgi:hypothetical protein
MSQDIYLWKDFVIVVMTLGGSINCREVLEWLTVLASPREGLLAPQKR